MLETSKGLRETYNMFHDSSEKNEAIRQLRLSHTEMDIEVLKAYGWHDIKLHYDFHETKQGVKYTTSADTRREILQRLLKLNYQRYEEEFAQGVRGGSQNKLQREAKSTGRGQSTVQRGLDFGAE